MVGSRRRAGLEVTVGDDPEDQCAEEELRESFDVGRDIEQRVVGAFPHKRIRDHDRGGIARWPPVRREVDDRGIVVGGEEDVACQVAVNELSRLADPAESPSETEEMLARL
jgi:hypothetical protein